MTLRQARILSSETDNTIKQEQNTNVNINIKPNSQRSQSIPQYPTVEPLSNNINFTPASPPMEFHQGGQNIDATAIPNQVKSQYLSQHPTNNQCPIVTDRGIADLGNELDELDKRNKFLEMLVEMYENNPLRINSYVVCDSRLLMDMIKLLTDCDKVDIVLNDDIGCGGCCANSDKLMYVSKILITVNGNTQDLKYCCNDIYSQFIKYGVSLKMVV